MTETLSVQSPACLPQCHCLNFVFLVFWFCDSFIITSEELIRKTLVVSPFFTRHIKTRSVFAREREREREMAGLGWFDWILGLLRVTFDTITQRVKAVHLPRQLPLIPLSHMTCIITGATSGIGLETARYCYIVQQDSRLLLFLFCCYDLGFSY